MSASASAMTAPLSLFLTRFSAPLVPLHVAEIEVAIPEPTIVLTEAELAARIAAATEAARAEAEERHLSETATLIATHEAALADALANARAEWAATTGEQFANLIDTRLGELRTALADRLADVLRPLFGEAVRLQTIEALTTAIDKLLSDPARPAIRISGPDDLVAVLRARYSAPGIEWIVADGNDVTITAGATHIATRLAAAMAEVAATEASHVG